jgi:hypothetical protein
VPNKNRKMKKTEIIQLSLILFGLFIIYRTIETITVQTSIILSYDNGFDSIYSVLFGFTVVIILLTFAGFFLIKKSAGLSKRIVKEKNEENRTTILTRFDTINIAIVILSLYFMISAFPRFIGSTYTLIDLFITDYKSFKEFFPAQLWTIIQYMLIIFIFTKSNYISKWIEEKLF